jgi:hypothetical protein
MNTVEPKSNSLADNHRWHQYSLRALLTFVTIVAILCSIGVCTHWIVSAGLSALLVSVVPLVRVTAQASASVARIIAVTTLILGVGVNMIYFLGAAVSGLIGAAHGTDTDPDFNRILALSGLTLAAIALVNCLTLLLLRRGLFKAIVPVAVFGNGVALVLSNLAVTHPTLDVIGGAPFFYVLAFVSINAIAVRVTFLVRLYSTSKPGVLVREALTADGEKPGHLTEDQRQLSER